MPFLVLLFWALFTFPCLNQTDIKPNLGVFATDNPTAIANHFRLFINHLKVQLGKKLKEPVKISIQVASNYERGLESLKSGEVDFLRFGPASYIEIKNCKPELRILAIGYNEEYSIIRNSKHVNHFFKKIPKTPIAVI